MARKLTQATKRSVVKEQPLTMEEEIRRQDAWAKRINTQSARRKRKAPADEPRPPRHNGVHGWAAWRDRMVWRAKLVLRGRPVAGSAKAEYARAVLNGVALVDRHLRRGEVDEAVRRASLSGVAFGWLSRENRSTEREQLVPVRNRAKRKPDNRHDAIMQDWDKRVGRWEERADVYQTLADTYCKSVGTIKNLVSRYRPRNRDHDSS